MGSILLHGIDETTVEEGTDDGVGRIRELVFNSGQHAATQLIGNVHASSLGLGLGGIAGIYHLLKTLDKNGHRGRVDTVLLFQKGSQSIGHRHTGSIADRVGAVFQFNGNHHRFLGLHFLLLFLFGIYCAKRSTRNNGEC